MNEGSTTVSRLDIGLNEKEKYSLELNGRAPLTITPTFGSGGTRNYNNLINKPQINGVTLIGNTTLADLNIVSENTAEGWGSNPAYIPKYGEICLYSDTGKIKIGDGSVPIVDLPYVGSQDNQAIMNALTKHVENKVIHVTAEEKAFWNAKLNYDVSGETLTFTRN